MLKPAPMNSAATIGTISTVGGAADVEKRNVMHEATKKALVFGIMISAGVTLMTNTAFASSLPSNIRTEHSTLGTVYAAASGKTVYEFKQDKPHSGKSTCTGKCTIAWHPVKAPAGFHSNGDWGEITRKSGTKQLTYRGWPLYTWVGDKKPGQVTGQGAFNAWRVVTTDGHEPGWSQKP